MFGGGIGLLLGVALVSGVFICEFLAVFFAVEFVVKKIRTSIRGRT